MFEDRLEKLEGRLSSIHEMLTFYKNEGAGSITEIIMRLEEVTDKVTDLKRDIHRFESKLYDLYQEF